jgi:ATP-binding cassette, subfamily B, bacterial
MKAAIETDSHKQGARPQDRALRRYVWMLTFLKPYRVLLAFMVASGVIIAVGELAIPQLIQLLIDEVLPGRKLQQFYVMLGIMLGIIVILVGANIARNVLMRMVGAQATRDLQFSVLQHVRKLGFSYYEKHPVGETLSLLNDQVNAMQRLYMIFFPQMLETLLFLIAALAIMLKTSVMLSLIGVPFMLLYYIFGPFIDRNVSRFMRAMTKDRIEFNRKIHETVSGVREFRAYSAEAWDLSEAHGRFDILTRSTLGWVKFIHARWALRGFSFSIGSIGMFLYGYKAVAENVLTTGEFIAFTLVYSIVMMRISMLLGNLVEQNMMLAQMVPFYELMMTEPEVEEPAPSRATPLPRVQGRLAFEGVSFAYPGRPNVIRSLDLEVSPGERLAIVGTTGGGKSTMLKLICRFYDPTEGTIRLDGVPLTELSFGDLRGAIGYVFQEPYLFGLTIRENIRFGNPDATDEEIEAAAKAAYAHDFIMESPLGYETIVGDRGVKLSGGQKQRIVIARMIVKNPQIVLLDEATSSLDNVSEGEVKLALDRLLGGRTMIAVAHRLSTIKDFDRILVMDSGSVAESGTYDELMALRGLFYQLALGQQESEPEAVPNRPTLVEQAIAASGEGSR